MKFHAGIVLGIVTSLAGSLSASATITLDVVASSAPNAFGSPSWNAYVANALNSLQTTHANIGSRSTDPTAYEIAGSFIQPGDIMVSSFTSWMGVAGPLAAPFSAEHGNRLHFGLHAYGDGVNKFKLEDLTFALHSSDSTDSLFYEGNFIGYNYSATRLGVDWVDGIRGNGNDIVYTSGNGTTLVDELVYVGVGNAWWPSPPPFPDQAAMDNVANWMLANASLTISGQYWIQGYTGIDTATVVPEPSTYVAGALLLLPFGINTIRRLRKN